MTAKNMPELRQVSIGSLLVDPNQPRRDFGRESELKKNLAPLEALASSIKDQGILQPIIVRTAPKGKLMIVAGERRWRAAQMAGLSTVPVIVREDLTGKGLELAQLSENLQRQDLGNWDVAIAIAGIMERYPDLQKKDLAKLLNRSPSYISRMLGMIDPEWESLVLSNVITYASVLEAFKGKTQAVRELAVSESRESGKPITHLALKRAEEKLVHRENAVAVKPEVYDKLMADMGFFAPPSSDPASPGIKTSQAIVPSSYVDFDPAAGSKPASSSFVVGTLGGDRAENTPGGFVHQAKMGWDSYVELLAAVKPAAKPVLVEVPLTSAEIRSALRELGATVPREEFEQLPALMQALRAKSAKPPAKKPRR